MKCFYHSADLDGKCSAAIVQRKYPEIELIGIDYGQPFPWESITPGEPVIMVDFSLQPFSDMLRLRKLTDALVWIDHHKTVLAEAKNAGWTSDGRFFSEPFYVAGLRRDGIGACVLTWEYLFPGEPTPRAVQLLGEYDAWDHHDPDCLPFQYGVRALGDMDPTVDSWGPFTGDPDEGWFSQACHDGLLILTYQRQQNEGHAKTLCFEAELDGLKLLAANAGPTNSQFFDSVWDPDKYHAMCLFSYRPKSAAWTISLYSTRDDVDCSEVCKAHGGGGHKGAAGFQCKELPFNLTAPDGAKG